MKIYNILELSFLTPDQVKLLAENYSIEVQNKGKQQLMYDILDVQAERLKTEPHDSEERRALDDQVDRDSSK